MVLKPNAVVDIAKPGPQLQNLTGMWNARVLDGFTPFVVQFKENGLPVNLTGLNAFIEGDIGEGHYDSATDDIVMTGTPKSVRYTDDGSGNTNMGIVVFRLPPQFFIQTGIFKGFIGLQSSTGIRSTSNDVWFKVLGSSYTMGISCKYFISDFQKALDQANGKIDHALDDLYNKYNQKAGQAEGGLDKVLAAIEEIKSTQQNLNTQLKGTQDQIKINDVVRRQEFEDLSGKINEQLSQMNFKPNYYLNYQDMTNKNPQGTHDACVTTDNYHIWLYNFDNSTWQDGGQMTNYGLDPQTENAVATSNPNNLLYDPDFKLSSSWINGGNGKPLVQDIYQHESINGSNVISISEIDKGGSLSSQQFFAKGHKQVSFGVWANLSHAIGNVDMAIYGNNDDNSAFTCITRLNIPNSTDDDLHFIKSEYCVIPDGITKIWAAFEMNDKGTLLICRPQVNFGNHLLPYSVQEVDEVTQNINQKLDRKSDNLILNPDFYTLDHWTISQEGLTALISKDAQFDNSNIVTLNNPDDSAKAFTSDLISNPNKVNNMISFGFWAKFADDCSPSINIWWNSTAAYRPSLNFINDDKWHYYLVNNNGTLVDPGVKNIKVDFVLNKKGSLSIARPQMNWGNHLNPYSGQELNDNINLLWQKSNNSIIDPGFLNRKHWIEQPNGKPLTIQFTNDDSAGNNNIVSITENDQGGSYASENIPVGNHKTFSFGALATVTGAKGDAALAIWSEKGCISIIKISNSDGTTLLPYAQNNVQIPDGTKNIHFAFSLSDKGTMKAACPYIVFGNRYDSTLPYIDIKTNAIITDKWVNAPFVFNDGKNKINGFMQISIQGDSSRIFPKKNYKIKTFEDPEFKTKLKWRPKSSWNSNNKFNLKANWVDATQARNLTNARIFERATDVTPCENIDVAKKLGKAQAMGQMEGFPIEVYLNGQYNGLYTLNTKKDEKTFGMDSDNVGEEAIVFEDVGSQLKRYPTKFDGSDYSTIVQDKPTANLKTNFDNFIKFLVTASDNDIKANLKDYIDVHSVMNTYLWGVLAEVWDTSGKSNLLLTYNEGKYFYMIPYDMDSTWSLKPDGNIYSVPLPEYDFNRIGDKSVMQFVTEENDMKIFNIMYRLFKPELKEQYFKLRQNVWSNSTIIDEFKKFVDSIPQSAYKREHDKWPQVPSYKKADFGQLQEAIIQRGYEMDNFMEHLTDPVQPTQAAQQTQATEAKPAVDKPATPAPTDNKPTDTTSTDGK